MKVIGYVCLGLLISGVLHGQEYYFSHYPFDPGLEEIKGNVLYQDPNHRIWIGSDRGLLSFDGMEYKREVLSHASGDLLNVTAINADSTGLWLGTAEGQLLHSAQGKFVQCDSIAHPIRALMKDARGVIWAATYGEGLMQVCGTKRYSTNSGDLLSDDIYAIAMGNAGNIWIGTDAGISILNTNSNNTSATQLIATNGIRDEIIMALHGSTDGMMWAGAFEGGICAIDSTSDVSYPFAHWDYGAILSVASVDDREIWLSTERNGLLRYDRRLHEVDMVQIPGNATPVITDMVADNEGNLWLLDVYKGLYRTNRRFQVYSTELEGIQALLFDHKGRLFAGHPSGLYEMWPGDTVAPKARLKDVNVLSLYEDKNGNLWVGTFGQGLYCMPANGATWYHYKKDNGLTDESILSIAGVNDKLWLATLGGVTRVQVEDPPHPYRLSTNNYNLADGLGTNFIYTAQADSRGRVWFGTDGKGLSVLENGQIRNYQVADSVPLHAVYSITETTQGDVCFVTDRDGIFRFDGNTFTQVALPLSLRDKEINNIITDKLGNLLLAHSNGVDIITPDNNIVRYLESPTEPLSPNLNAHFIDSTGAIWIAGLHKIVRYNPLAMATRNYPATILNGVSVFLEPVDFQVQHVFRATDNYITFSYIGLWYSNPREVMYRYVLQGLDPDWKETRERSVTYQHIPPGAYRFVLQSSVSGQYSNTGEVSYAFTIEKPFYQRTGVLILAGLLFLLILYIIFRLNQRRIERAAALQRRQIESQLQTLKAQINPHFLFNSFNTLVSVIEDDPEAAVEYVENLSDFYRSILKYRAKNLIPIREEIEILKSYAYILEKRYGNALHIRIADQWKESWVVPLVLQILIENAVKHNVIAERRPLSIDVRMKDETAIIVENTLQIKQATEDSTGFGLQSIISRYTLLSNRAVEVGQTQNTFYVIIPALRKDELPDT